MLIIYRHKDLYISWVNLNSKVCLRNDCIIHDENISFTDDVDYVPDTPLLRASSDYVCNRFGIQLLDLCKPTSVRIFNGRLGDDHGVCAYKYISHQDASVIDRKNVILPTFVISISVN